MARRFSFRMDVRQDRVLDRLAALHQLSRIQTILDPIAPPVSRRQRLARAAAWGMIILLALLAVILMADLIIALGAEACGQPDAGGNCYPWSPRAEGPIDGAWNYNSKSLYLFAGGVHLTFMVTAMLAMICWRNLRGILLAVCLLGAHGLARAWADQAIGSRTDIIELSDLPKLL